MVEKIKPSDEVFQQAVNRGDRAKIAEWDAQGLIEWSPKNFIGQRLSEEAQWKRKAQEVAGDEPTSEQPEPSRLGALGIAKDERLWPGHRLVQGAVRRGDGELLAEIYADDRYDTLRGSAPDGAFTRSDIEAYMTKDAS